MLQSGDLRYEDFLPKLQYKVQPEDRPIISYNIGTSDEPKFEKLERISIGQKCTAMLILALSDGEMPILIDQPEDSLDLRAIWNDMCTKVRNGKDKRQLIFTTHNSSVAVASDTDKYIIMAADAEKGRVIFSGAIDNEDIKGQIISYLRGWSQTIRFKIS